MWSDKVERNNIHTSLALTTLSEQHRHILKLRLEALLNVYSYRSKFYSLGFNGLRITITVGSLIVPALLSIQSPSDSSYTSMNIKIYWVVWIISLFVTISNGIITLFKVDKKYYNLNTTYQHIISETWQFIELSGKYSGYHTPGVIPTHENQYMYFCNVLEKIQMKNVEDEYYKITEHSPVKTHPMSSPDSLIPPTPLNVIVAQNSHDTLNGGSITPGKTDDTTVRRYDGENAESSRQNE
jgi:hypothetical protein